MLDKIFSVFKIPNAKPLKTDDPAQISKEYNYWRIRIMYSLFIGYAVFYFCRKNLSAVMPALGAELHYSKTELGLLWSGLYLSYGISKFLSGILSDKSNPRVFMATGLFLSALANIFFGMSSSLVALAIFWILNGWVQAMGWPPCARSLTHWYSLKERGVAWGIWNASHQVGGAGILILAAFLAEHYGWRSAFFVPAAIAIVVAIFLLNRLRDTPSSLGLPPIEVYKKEATREIEEEGKTLSVREILFNNVLKNPYIWLIAWGNFFVYIVRFGVVDWMPTYLVEVKQMTLSKAGITVAAFELAGIFGAFIAGWLSDRWFKGRGQVNALFMFMLFSFVVVFWFVPPGQMVLAMVILGLAGFVVYGPQMLTSLHAADLVSKNATGTATGLVGFLGYMGSLLSGVGTGFLVDKFGWAGGFYFFAGSSILGVFLFLLTFSAKAKITVKK